MDQTKGNVTYKSASETTEVQDAPADVRDDSDVKLSPQESKVDVPIALYADLKGVPYTAKYFGVEGIWSNPDIGMKDEVQRIDKAYKRKVQNGELADGSKSFEAFIKEAEKVTKTTMSPTHVRISKIAAYLSFMADLKAIDKMANRNDKPDTYKSEQKVLNKSFDEVLQNLTVLPVEYSPDGSLMRKVFRDLTILKDDTSTSGYIYLGYAVAGSNTLVGKASAIWRIVKIGNNGEDLKTWADGNTNFDNVWDNRATTIVYS